MVRPKVPKAEHRSILHQYNMLKSYCEKMLAHYERKKYLEGCIFCSNLRLCQTLPNPTECASCPWIIFEGQTCISFFWQFGVQNDIVGDYRDRAFSKNTNDKVEEWRVLRIKMLKGWLVKINKQIYYRKNKLLQGGNL